MGKPQKIIQLILTFFLWSLVLTAIHEMFHAIYGQWVCGAAQSSTFHWFWSGSITACSNAMADKLFWMAGGLGAFLIMFGFWALARWSPTWQDLDDEFVCAVLGAFQFSYGICEPMFKWHKLQAATTTPLVVALFVLSVTFYYAYRWAIYFNGGGKQ